MANITFLPTQGTININGEKVIALNQTNIDLLKKAYNTDPTIINSQNAVSNKDLLAQSFGISEPVQTTESLPNNINVESIPPIEEPTVQLTNIPTMQTSNLEINPANLNMEPTQVIEPINPEVAPANPIDLSIEGSLDPLKDLQAMIPNTNLEVSPLESVNVEPIAPVTENSAPTSPFQVTSAPNIFDQPSVEINEPTTNPEIGNVLNDLTLSIPNIENIVGQTPNEPTNLINNETLQNNNLTENIKNDKLYLEIELEKENAELYEKLASNCRKKIELLESKLQINDSSIPSNEPTASDLFTSTGLLDENKVLNDQV